MLRLACCFFKAAIAFYSVGAKLVDAPGLPAGISLNLAESLRQSARIAVNLVESLRQSARIAINLVESRGQSARISLNLVESRGQSARLSRIQPVFFFSKVNQGGVVLCRSRRLYKKRTPLKSWRSI